MIIKLGKYYELKVYLNKLEKRTGICSQKFNEPDKHMLLWDFDEESLTVISCSLSYIQAEFALPNILILESSPKKYHAYCLTLLDFQDVIKILAATPFIDMSYLRLGVARGYFTLRISERNRVIPKPVKILRSKYPDEMTLDQATIHEYLTSNRGQFNNEKN